MLKTIIGPTGELIDRIMAVLQASVENLKAVLEQDLRLPVLAAIYMVVTTLMDMDEEADFTAINGILFMLAISTVAMVDIGGLGDLTTYNTIGCD